MNDNIILEPSIEGKKRKNFTIIDNPLIDDITTFELSDGAFRLLVILIRYDGLETITFSAKTLSEKTGKKPRTTFARLKELEDKGYITREQRHFKTSANLIRQTSSVISLEPYWDKVNRAQEKWIDTHKPASTLTSSESAKNGTLDGVPKSALPNNSDLDAPDSSVDAGLDDVSRECKNQHSDKDSDKDINKDHSDLPKSDVLFYVQSVVDFFNSLKIKYPDKIEKKVNRPKKQQTVETFSDKRYRAILKWYNNNIALPVIFSCIERWIKELPKERKISGINYFENYKMDTTPKKRGSPAKTNELLQRMKEARNG